MAYDLSGVFQLIENRLRNGSRKSLSTIAREIGISRHTLTKAVRAAQGRPFRDFVGSHTLEHACLLLADSPGRSIKEVSLLLGYRSSTAFCRFIRHLTGFTPVALRELLRSMRPLEWPFEEKPLNAEMYMNSPKCIPTTVAKQRRRI
jgi:AraC-like DNA-binding protein